MGDVYLYPGSMMGLAWAGLQSFGGYLGLALVAGGV